MSILGSRILVFFFIFSCFRPKLWHESVSGKVVDKGGIVTLRGGSYRLLLIYSTSFDFNKDSNEAENDYIRLID